MRSHGLAHGIVPRNATPLQWRSGPAADKRERVAGLYRAAGRRAHPGIIRSGHPAGLSAARSLEEYATWSGRCADEGSCSVSSDSFRRGVVDSSPRKPVLMSSCCFCCNTRNGSLATGISSILIRGFTILGYVLMLTAPRYETTKLHRQDEKSLISLFTLGCLNPTSHMQRSAPSVALTSH
ncbi:hypothetical protein HPB47_023016 [Ixodes persulcatus]|uniref:Uncharacterized protein n=1 Tax=Ixodes persulcatus TaxID=34615 RepID=A0AC60QAE8_IXOPE|nr:hypothetical protein HPB47_023016 [Ixodes persulcatus]